MSEIDGDKKRITQLEEELAKLKSKKDISEMSEEEWVEFQISQWKNGSANCQMIDQGKVISYLFKKIKELKK